MLADGGTITKTQSAVVLEKLIGQFLFDKAAAGGAKVTNDLNGAGPCRAARALCCWRALVAGCATPARRATIRSSR